MLFRSYLTVHQYRVSRTSLELGLLLGDGEVAAGVSPCSRAGSVGCGVRQFIPLRPPVWVDRLCGEERMGTRIVLLFCATTAMAADSSSVTFYKDVLPVLQKNCQSCHRPDQIAPMSFLDYKSTRPWAKAMKAAVASRKMPPWFADPGVGHLDRKSTRLNSSHSQQSRMPSSA